MDVYRMIEQLGERIEDAAKINFTETMRLDFLKNAEMKLIGMLYPSLLTELEKTAKDVNITASGEAKEAGVCNITAAALGYNVIEGKKGIRQVKISGSSGLYCNPIDFDDIKELEGYYRKGTATNPRYWIFQNKIYLQPSTISAIDVSFLRMPNPLLFQFSTVIYGGGSNTQFYGKDDEGLEEYTDNYYKGAVIYSTKHNSYHIITSYSASGQPLFTVSPSAASIFSTGYKFFFLTHDFDHLNLSKVESDLNPSLHELEITLAEEQYWALDHKPDRCKLAWEKAYEEIKMRNAMAEAKELEKEE